MQCPTCPFYRFRRHRALDCATGVHSTADTTWNKQPGEETHLHSLAVNGCAEKITCRLPAPINTASKLDPTSLPGCRALAANRLEPLWRASRRQPGEMDGSGPVDPDRGANTSDRYQTVALAGSVTGVRHIR